MTVKISELAVNLKEPGIVPLFLRFLYKEFIITQRQMDRTDPKVSVVTTATSMYFVPSDCSGTTGYTKELIHAMTSYRKKFPHYDTIFVRTGLTPGPHGLSVAQLHVLFSFTIKGVHCEVALVEWFSYVGNSPDEDIGMWVVQREKWQDGSPLMDFIFIDTILQSYHLLSMYGEVTIPSDVTYVTSLTNFKIFYVNKFADHHSFELLS